MERVQSIGTRLCRYLVVYPLLTVLLFALLELGARTYLRIFPPAALLSSLPGQLDLDAYRGEPWLEEFRPEVEALNAATISSKVYTPLGMWREHPFSGEQINIMPDGFRYTVNQPDSQLSKRQLFVFGGSTVFGAHVPDAHTIPSYLARFLAERFADHPYLVRNYGMAAFVFDQEISLLVKLLMEGERPEAVVFYHGVNDVFAGVVAGQPHLLYDRFEATLDRRIMLREFGVSLLGRLAILKVLGVRPKINYTASEQLLEERVERLYSGYEQKLKFISDVLAPAYGFQVLIVWQPDLFSTGKELTDQEKEIRKEHHPTIAKSYQLAVTHPRRSALVHTLANYVDCHDCLDDLQRAVFVDYCHVTSAANREIARKIVENGALRKVFSSPTG